MTTDEEKKYYTQKELSQLHDGLEKSLALLGLEKEQVKSLLYSDLPTHRIMQWAQAFLVKKEKGKI